MSASFRRRKEVSETCEKNDSSQVSGEETARTKMRKITIVPHFPIEAKERAARAGEAAVSASSQLLIEASRQLEALICGREVKLGIIAHVLFMPHLFRALPNTAVNPVTTAAKAALKDVAARAAAIVVPRKKPRSDESAGQDIL